MKKKGKVYLPYKPLPAKLEAFKSVLEENDTSATNVDITISMLRDFHTFDEEIDALKTKVASLKTPFYPNYEGNPYHTWTKENFYEELIRQVIGEEYVVSVKIDHQTEILKKDSVIKTMRKIAPL
jgi:hypothetical protein